MRQYIPKNTDFKDITDKEIREYQYKINNRPRKVLDFQKPKDLFYQKVIWKIALDGIMGEYIFLDKNFSHFIRKLYICTLKSKQYFLAII